MSPGEQFELGVDTAFQTVCGGFDPVRFKDCFWGLEVDKQQVASPEVVETVVGLAHVVVCPHASPRTGFGVFDRGFLIHPGLVDRREFVQLRAPFCRFIQGGDPSQFQCKLVDGAPGICARA